MSDLIGSAQGKTIVDTERDCPECGSSNTKESVHPNLPDTGNHSAHCEDCGYGWIWTDD